MEVWMCKSDASLWIYDHEKQKEFSIFYEAYLPEYDAHATFRAFNPDPLLFEALGPL